MNQKKVIFTTLSIILFAILLSCETAETPLAPYMGQTEMSKIRIEEGSFTPTITWVGGYVSTFGVNRGTEAALDSSLIWLIHSEGNNINFPLSFGQTSNEIQELTTQYGGNPVERLSEDNVYTFWVLKEDALDFVFQNPNKPIYVDGNIESEVGNVRNDTVFVNSFSYTRKTQALDVFVNIVEATSRGKLATLSIAQSSTTNNPTVMWEIKQSGVTEKTISAMGLCIGTSYSASRIVWEVWSVETVDGQDVYGKKNVIDPPLVIGDSFQGTHVFYAYPEGGLERNKNYYFWIGNQDWDGKKHGRVAKFYAYITFKTS